MRLRRPLALGITATAVTLAPAGPVVAAAQDGLLSSQVCAVTDVLSAAVPGATTCGATGVDAVQNPADTGMAQNPADTGTAQNPADTGTAQ
ncbi:hypothetical protein AB0J38_29960, partial [Streptomyces sp. NPDC050095]